MRIGAVGQEIGWRGRDIARDLCLRLGISTPEAITPLSENLDNP